eukprot:5948794-Pleurochrysis_carterae.AAC.1
MACDLWHPFRVVHCSVSGLPSVTTFRRASRRGPNVQKAHLVLSLGRHESHTLTESLTRRCQGR